LKEKNVKNNLIFVLAVNFPLEGHGPSISNDTHGNSKDSKDI